MKRKVSTVIVNNLANINNTNNHLCPQIIECKEDHVGQVQIRVGVKLVAEISTQIS